jgi:hypothetical protein
VKKDKTPKLDDKSAEAVDSARAALLDLVDESQVGEHLGATAEATKVVTHYFACTQPG